MAFKGVSRDPGAVFRKRFANAILIGVPLLGSLAVPVWFASHSIGYAEVLTFVGGYLWIGIGIGAGFHRLFSHRSYRPHKAIRLALALAGSMAAQGSLLRWVIDHRRHHARTDVAGDTHSPHVDARGRPIDGRRGFVHAHIGWMFDGTVTDPRHYGRDLLRDPFFMAFHRTRWLWPLLSLAIPATIGFACRGTDGAIGCLLTGGCLKITIFQNFVWAVNSVGHLHGRRPFPRAGQARNNRLLAWATLGDGWHNNHHFAPRSAFHGIRAEETDITGALITWLQRRGLVSDVIRPNHLLDER